MTDAIILVGGGGHCRSCIDVLESSGKKIAGILDKEGGKEIMGIPVIGTDEMLDQLVKEGYSFLVTVGQIENPRARVNIHNRITNLGGKLATCISVHAILARNTVLGEGTIVMHQALINSGAQIGENCIINTKALVEHDAAVGHHTHISTGAILNGNCNIGNRVFIGSNAVVINGVSIADDVVIGAGAVVIDSIDKAGLYAGNPARFIK